MREQIIYQWCPISRRYIAPAVVIAPTKKPVAKKKPKATK